MTNAQLIAELRQRNPNDTVLVMLAAPAGDATKAIYGTVTGLSAPRPGTHLFIEGNTLPGPPPQEG